jgi:hypothetical protein
MLADRWVHSLSFLRRMIPRRDDREFQPFTSKRAALLGLEGAVSDGVGEPPGS